jgi:hypothetical protein
MDPITASIVAGGIGEVGGSLLGGLFGKGDRRRQRQAIDAALRDVQGADAEADSSWGGVETDPALRVVQRSVLDKLAREGSSTGLDVQDRAALSEAQGQVARQERGSREAILQDMARRGMSGSGSELAAALANQQGSADRSASVGAAAAADARGRQLAALSASGEMAGAVRGQDFGEKAAKAAGLDSVATFNANNRLRKAGLVSGVRLGQAAQAGADAERWGGIGAGLGSATGQGVGYFGGKK